MKRKFFRNQLKKKYKEYKKDDAKIGKKINLLTQELMKQYRLSQADRDAIAIESNMKELSDLKKENRFNKDFPTLRSFVKFLKENDLTVKTLEEGTGE